MTEPVHEIVEMARSILERADYTTYQHTQEGHFVFEDESLQGLLMVAPCFLEISEHWESVQDRFIHDYAKQLQASPDKAWNTYLVFLTPEPIGTPNRYGALKIEEDFRAARKIVHGGIVSREDVRRALLPFLPIQNLISAREHESAVEQLSVRLRDLAEPFAWLADSRPTDEICRALLEKR